jgi:hypothetical protein
MTALNTEIQTLALNNETKIKIEAVSFSPSGDQKARITDLQFDNITNVIKEISSKLLTSIKEAKPKKATVEFGLAVGVESGRLTALWVKGQGTAHINVTLEWEGD